MTHLLNFEFSSWMPMLLLLHRALSTKPALLSNGRRSFFPRRCCFPLNFSLQGDVILIDNLTVMHSRQTFVPPRRTLARYFLSFFACLYCSFLTLPLTTIYSFSFAASAKACLMLHNLNSCTFSIRQDQHICDSRRTATEVRQRRCSHSSNCSQNHVE